MIFPTTPVGALRNRHVLGPWGPCSATVCNNKEAHPRWSWYPWPGSRDGRPLQQVWTEAWSSPVEPHKREGNVCFRNRPDLGVVCTHHNCYKTQYTLFFPTTAEHTSTRITFVFTEFHGARLGGAVNAAGGQDGRLRLVWGFCGRGELSGFHSLHPEAVWHGSGQRGSWSQLTWTGTPALLLWANRSPLPLACGMEAEVSVKPKYLGKLVGGRHWAAAWHRQSGLAQGTHQGDHFDSVTLLPWL